MYRDLMRDLRQNVAVPTPKLLAALAAYQALFAKASARAPSAISSFGPHAELADERPGAF